LVKWRWSHVKWRWSHDGGILDSAAGLTTIAKRAGRGSKYHHIAIGEFGFRHSSTTHEGSVARTEIREADHTVDN